MWANPYPPEYLGVKNERKAGWNFTISGPCNLEGSNSQRSLLINNTFNTIISIRQMSRYGAGPRWGMVVCCKETDESYLLNKFAFVRLSL